MCALLTNAEKAADGSTRPVGGISYCARVQIHANEGFVDHIVDAATSPTVVGIVRKRWFTFDGPDRLTLKIDDAESRTPLVEGRDALPVVDNTLVFERVRPGQ
jgi:hypothetical protein